MIFAGNIPLYNGVDIIAFDGLPELFPKPASTPYPFTWAKIQETERRLNYYDWFTTILTHENRMIATVSDLMSGFLYSFEAAVQVFKREAKKSDEWLSTQTACTLTMRGLRSLRNVAAHIHLLPVGRVAGLYATSRFTGGVATPTRPGWLFP